MDSRPAADEIAALLEPIARQRVAGAADARIANWCAAELGIPVSRLQTRLRNQGLLTGDLDLAGFCVERIRQLLD